MKTRSLVTLVVALGCLSIAVAYSTASSLDGQNPPHALDTDGKTIPESSATQPDKPIIFSKDSKDPIYLELKPEAAFDHTKHNTGLLHTLDGKTPTSCVYCHHTEQPMPVAEHPYLTKSERTAVLTAKLLEAPGTQAVNSCRHCHFQVEEGSPKKIKYPKGTEPQDAKGEAVLTNRVAYHVKCISCHIAATKRDPNLKAPQGCAECHTKRDSATPTATMTSIQTPGFVYPTAAEATVNSSQVKLLRREGLSVQVRIQTLKANLARTKPQPKRDELLPILRTILSDALEAVQRTERSFKELQDPKSDLAAGEIFFGDLQASYRQALEDLVNAQAQSSLEARFRAASLADGPRYPALAQGTLRVLEQNVLAYNVVANQGDLTFNLDVTSVPAGATVFYRRRGDSERKSNKPTNSTVPALVYAIWFVRFQLPGYRDDEREHDPFREPNHVLNVELRKE